MLAPTLQQNDELINDQILAEITFYSEKKKLIKIAKE